MNWANMSEDKSKRLKIVQITCASIWCLFSAGIVFGFAALKTILIKEGIYADMCQNDIGTLEAKGPCVEQDLKLNFLFTAAAGVTNVIALPVGTILDRYGPRVCGIIGAFWIICGSQMFIWSDSLLKYTDPYLTGYILLAVGGPFVFISCFQLANTFPKRSGSILSLITGTFDSSAALFLFYRIIYEKWDSDLHLSKFFKIYLVVPLFIIFCQLFFMPHESYKTQGNVMKLSVEGLDENGHLLEGDDGSAIIPDQQERQSLLSQETMEQNGILTAQRSRQKSVLETYVEAKLEKKTGGIFGILHGYTVREQLKSPLFYLMVIFTTICMLRINYFVATIRSQEEYLLGDFEKAATMNSIFDVALPLGGLVSIPLTGIILDHFKTLDTLAIVMGTSITIGILGLIPHSFVSNLIGIVLLVVYRPFYYTVVSDYVSKVFGFDTFGTIYGTLICISGVLNMFQSVLDAWTHNIFKMNPFPINFVLVLVTIISGSVLLQRAHSEVREKHAGKQSLSEEEIASSSNTTTYGTN